MACVKPWASKEASAHHIVPKQMALWENSMAQSRGTVLLFIFCVVTTSQNCIFSIFVLCMPSNFRSLNKLVTDQPKSWDTFLQSTMFGLRTKKQLTTKYSPYFLMLGTEARHPSESPKEYKVML